ncbi:MAG: hypothetical protein IJC36_02115 [Clostridia bacterium]|nr:hypothetical protein [Clostridia bacterium]
MKKTLCLLLAVLIVACSLPTFITSYAEDADNLLAEATYASGAVSWTDKIDPRTALNDNKTNSVYGGYSWTFGLGYPEVAGDKYEYVNIKATGLTVGANYSFSYIYQRDFVFAIDSIKSTNGDNADYIAPVTTNVAEKERSYMVSTMFTVPVNGDYTIKLKINRDMRTADCQWDTVALSDLSLTKTESLNFAENYTYANGDVTWTTTTNVAQKIGNIDSWGVNDNKDKSVNGGYSWSFGLGDGNVAGDVYAYVYIKAKGLTANTRYDFSYIYQKDFIIAFDSITDKDGTKVELENPSKDVAITGGDRAHQVFATFLAPADGDYTITLKTNRDMRPADCAWSHVVLSDLVLIKSTSAAKVAAEVLVSGYGDATVSDELPAIGSEVTYTAAPWQDEEFLGWYNGEEKVSDNLVYTFVIAEKTTLTAKFTSNNLNVLAGKKASDWTGWHWLKVADSSESKNGGKGYLLSSVMWQSMYTTVTLKPNTEYDFSFNWKGVANEKGSAYPYEIMVYPVNAANIEDRANNWTDGGDGGMFQPKTGTDLEQGGGYATEADANSYQWKSVETAFTTTSETEYNVIVYFTIDSGTPGDQQVNVSDFVLKEKGGSVTPPPEDTGISNKDASDWVGYQWSKIENSTESHNGGKGYLVKDAMFQSMYTKVVLKPDTDYNFSFSFKSHANANGVAYPTEIKVYSVNSVDIDDRANNWQDGFFNPKTGTDLEQNPTQTTAEAAATCTWQQVKTNFKTTAETEYYVVVYFNIEGSPNNQQVNVSDFVLEEIVSLETDISKLDATDWTGYEWAKIENSTESHNGGKGYLVKEAMYQSIYTKLTLKPKTKYNLSFSWKAKEVAGVEPAYPAEIKVYSADVADIEDRVNNWKDGGNFVPKTGADLEQGSGYASAELAKAYEWQKITTSFNTIGDKEYNLVIHFTINGAASHQEVYVSDFKLEELGAADGGEEEDDADNLAANYTAAAGNVSWTPVADAWGSSFQDNKSASVYGGYAWTFGLANSDYEKAPAYAMIKTGDLEANHKYQFSFIYQKDFVIVFDSIDSGASVVKTEDVKLLEGDRAHRVTITFNTTKAGAHTIKLKMGKGMNNENCQWSNVVLCDLKLYDITNRVYGTVKSELGGTATGFDNAYCLKGEKVTLIATPRQGNTFVGWYDADNNLVSADAKFEFIAENDFNYLAVFSGSNIPNGDWLEMHDMDGTFEDGTMLDWKAEDRENGDDTSWAIFERSTDMAYNGKYSLRMRSRYRTTFFHFDDLKKKTTYRLSFYINHPDLYSPKKDVNDTEANNEALIRWFSITSGNTELYSESGSQGAPAIKGGSGWYKVNIYFNTGDFDEVDWNFYYTNKDGALKEYIYMDDVSLVEYTSGAFENGNFESGATPWRGIFSVDAGVAKLDENNSMYQNVEFGTNSLYTVSFRAKGKGTAGASEITTDDFNVTNYISSDSAVNINSDDWAGYSFKVFSGVHPAGGLFFKSTNGELLIDDIIVTKNTDRGGAIVEKIDFETERFALHNTSTPFEIYSGTAGDANVHSGTKSLRFNAAKAEKGVQYILEDAFVSNQIVSKLNYKLTLYYKTVKGNSLYLAPEFLPDDSVKTVYTAASNGWTKVDFIFNKVTNSYIKTIISNVLSKTTSDFYIDDITLSITPPMVVETNSVNKYCEWPLNVLNNEGFEQRITANDWANLPKTAQLRTDKGANGKNYLRIKAGTRYVLPVKVELSDSYYFSVSTRLGKNSSGYVGVASNPAGTALYNDISGKPSSKITVDSSKWNRDAFLFTTGESGYIYLVFEATKGYIDVDDVQLYKKQYGSKKDLNDHSIFVPYNYNNPDPSTVVLSGGDPTFGGKIDPSEYEDYLEEDYYYESDDSPSTGDDITIPVVAILLATLSALVLLITKDRFFKKNKGGNA